MARAKKTIEYTDAERELIAAMQRAGYSWLKIAEQFGYRSKTTMMNHAKRDPKLKALVRKGIEGSIADVANSLYKKAMGYDYYEETYGLKKNAEGIEELTLIKSVKKHVPADTFAMNSFLNNRAKELWKPRRDDIEKPKSEVIIVSIGGQDVKQLKIGQKAIEADYTIIEDKADATDKV